MHKTSIALVLTIFALVLLSPRPAYADTTTGLVGHWTFDGNALDSSGNGNNGTALNGPTYTTGKIGQALSFDGVDDAVDAGSGTSLDNIEQQGGGGMSVSFWINPDSNTTGYIIAKGASSNGDGNWHIEKSSVTNPARLRFVKEGATDASKYYNSVFDTGVWQHIVVTWNGSMTLSSGLQVYKNGVLIPNVSATDGSGANSDAGNDLCIGRASTYGGVGCAGVSPADADLDDVRIYNRALSSTDIAELYAQGSGGGGGDTTPPSVSLTSPTAGATLSGTASLAATASDPTVAGQATSGVAKVDFYYNSTLIGTDTTSPYTTTWNTTSVINGTYSLTAKATDSSNNQTTSSSVSVTVSNTTQDTTPPSTPTNLTTTPVSSSQINLSWTASTDPTVAGETTSGVTGYRLERCTGSSCTTFTQIATPTTNSYSDSSLTANTTYRYRVRATDASGNLSGYSSIVSGTTQAASGNRVDLLNSSNTVINTYSTIQGCANVATAGQTCLVYPGSYDERVRPTNSGSAGSPITFRTSGAAKVRAFTLIGKNYITIDGFEITHAGLTAEGAGSDSASVYLRGNNYIQIVNNTIHDTARECIVMWIVDPATDPSNDVLIKNNTLSHCGHQSGAIASTGITIYGNSNLVEDNDISHIGEDFMRLIGGNFNVIRDNYWHDNFVSDRGDGVDPHIDGVQNWCAPGNTPLHHALIENNRMINGTDANTHFSLFQDYGPCGESDIVLRHNTANNIGSGFTGTANIGGVSNLRAFNNTTVDIAVAQNPKPYTSFAALVNDSPGGKIINNLFYNTVRDSGGVYTRDASSAAGFYSDHNLGYNDLCGSSCTWSNPPDGISSEQHAVLNRNPLFTSYATQDFTLQSTSPAVDSGGYLTTVSSSDTGSGTSLVVGDAGFFQDGWAGVASDWITVGSTSNVAQIVSIDYANNIITLASSIARNDGDPVYLYKNSSGTQVLYGSAPDIGAYEYVSGTPTPTPVTPSPPGSPTNSSGSNSTGGTGSSSGSATPTQGSSSASTPSQSTGTQGTLSATGQGNTGGGTPSAGSSPAAPAEPHSCTTSIRSTPTLFPNTTSLTTLQIQSILDLLSSFGIDQTTKDQVHCALLGYTTPLEPTASQGGLPLTEQARFTRTLKQGDRGEDVRELQIYLNQQGFTVSTEKGGSPGNETAYFGAKTKAALIRFQDAHKQQILTPLHLTKGTGIFGPSTRGFVE